jgi:SAM-dependent methyltransferase
VDIGSHHKYVALLSKVIPVAYVDLRPPSIRLDTLAFVQGSVLDLPFGSRSVSSLSCLCVIEHIGLGRYGDPLDPYGTEKAVQELKRVMQPGGDLYVSFPVDDANRTYFNAHRAFREKYMLGLFEPFAPLEKRYIFGKRFLERPDMGFGTACYHLRSPR